MAYRKEFVIGDGWNSGHGKRITYQNESDKPADDVYTAHYKIKNIIGVALEGVCNEYEDTTV